MTPQNVMALLEDIEMEAQTNQPKLKFGDTMPAVLCHKVLVEMYGKTWTVEVDLKIKDMVMDAASRAVSEIAEISFNKDRTAAARVVAMEESK